MYGYRDILLAVLDYWEVLRQQYKEYGKLLQRSVKEEGVIYPDCKVRFNTRVSFLHSCDTINEFTVTALYEKNILTAGRHNYNCNSAY